jgi:hypothetical protein
MDVLTADRIVARMYSKTPTAEREGEFTLVGSKFENLRIAGHPVNLQLDFKLFETIPTYSDARKAFDKKGEFWKIAKDPFQTGHPQPAQGEQGAFFCSCVKDMETDCPGITRKGHSFHVKGFGTIFLGEVLIKHAQRTLTMVRLELGSAVSGSGTAAQAFSNGQHWP